MTGTTDLRPTSSTQAQCRISSRRLAVRTRSDHSSKVSSLACSIRRYTSSG